MEISFPFVACVRTAGRKKICQIVAVRFLQGGLGPFRELDAPRAPKPTIVPDLWPSQRPPGLVPAPQRLTPQRKENRLRGAL